VKFFLRLSLAWILLAFVGETVLAPLMAIGGVAPDFAVIALVILALAGGAFAGCLGGFVLGLAQDLVMPPLLGLNALCKTGIGYVLGRMGGSFALGMPLVEGLIIALATLIHATIYLLIRSWLSPDAFLVPLFIWAVPRSLYTGLVGIPLVRLADILGLLRRGD
jgi:rod shape-determining protein MreD